ncbi:MAG: hypothetical protein C9356_12500 [Oleiphilus sp.]|nr:MAG: hypothetical protein C9356_12500 [Oleiphilus sp.]
MKHEFDLPDGPTLDGVAQTCTVLKELSGVDYAQCLEEAEKIVQVPVGYDDKGNAIFETQLVASPNKMAMLVMRKRIARIGEFKAPIPDSVWCKLSASDINKLLEESNNFDDALSGVQPLGEAHSGSPET